MIEEQRESNQFAIYIGGALVGTIKSDGQSPLSLLEKLRSRLRIEKKIWPSVPEIKL